MPLIYTSVSRGTTTLAEYAAFSGNFSRQVGMLVWVQVVGRSAGRFFRADLQLQHLLHPTDA
jgi:hypothetical protein